MIRLLVQFNESLIKVLFVINFIWDTVNTFGIQLWRQRFCCSVSAETYINGYQSSFRLFYTAYGHNTSTKSVWRKDVVEIKITASKLTQVS